MREEIRKASPFVHFPQEVRHLDQRIKLADLGIQFLGCSGNLAGCRRDDQVTSFKANTFELPRTCPVRKALQVEVEHLPRFGKPRCAVFLNTKSKAILIFQSGER